MTTEKTKIEELNFKTVDDLKSWIPTFMQKYVRPKTLFILEGALGVGKTEFIKQLAAHLKFATVSSPTYSVLQKYEGQGLPPLYHVDLYRLKDSGDLESTGFWDLFSEEDAIIFIEWGNMIDLDHYPLNWDRVHLMFTKLDDDSREVILSRFRSAY